MKRDLGIVLTALILVGCNCGLQDAGREAERSEKTSVQDAAPSDAPLKPSQDELLAIAFETAAMIPVEPHLKSRSRTQEAVIEACLKLDQPVRAADYIKQIENWRSGLCYARLAYYCAEKELERAAEEYLALAASIAEKAEDWRKDRILKKIAQTRDLLEEPRTAKTETDSSESEDAPEPAFDEHMAAIEAAVAKGGLEEMLYVLAVSADAYRRFYGDVAKRESIETAVKDAWAPLPIIKRVEWLKTLAETAIEKGDDEKALSLLDEAQTLRDSYDWPLEHYMKVAADLGTLRFRAGQEEQARSDVAAALAMFDEGRSTILSTNRAGTLCSMAEAYQQMGDVETALEVYRRTIEEGAVNPNARPRAQDLSAACASMAVHGVEPDQELLERIYEIQRGLDDPW